MAKLDGTQIKERGKELKPAREFAFKLWQENPQITNAELEQALKEKGFEVNVFTRNAWLSRFRKSGLATTNTRAHTYKVRKPTPAQELAFKLWQENPQISGPALHRVIKEKDFDVSLGSCYLWLQGFRKKDEAVDTFQEKPSTAVEPSEFTLEQIIKAAGSVETLSVLFYQGVMHELTRKDAVNHILKQECISKDNKISSLKGLLTDVTRERNRVMKEYNEKLAKVKIGTLTLDETARRLVPKL